MHSPNKAEFIKTAQSGNLIPVWKELLADQDTPLSCYERLRESLGESDPLHHSFLLESVEGGEHLGRYSFLGILPRAVFEATGRSVTITTEHGDIQEFSDVDPLDQLKQYLSRFHPVEDPALPRFFGGAVGYLGYDAVAQFERVGLSNGPDSGWPDMLYAITDTIIIFDRVRHTLKVVANAFIEDDIDAAYDRAVQKIDRICDALTTPVPHRLFDAHLDPEELDVTSNMKPEQFKAAVEQCKEYIRAGDIIQTVLSQCFSSEEHSDPLDVYRALRSINPSPYMFCLEFGDRHIVGSSPEIHVRCENRNVELRPIAGTRPRAGSLQEDQRLAEELLADPKERAEHIMLVDLARNDLGRVCEYSTVSVPELMVIERYSHVMHIVSDVVGILDEHYDIYDLMRATFPAGTVSGAPKIRAMDIIAELEPTRRGPYAGAVGYFSFNGNLDSCITIRTVFMDGKTTSVQAGAGIVADSDPQKEYEETRNKARGMLKALALAKQYGTVRSEETAS